MPPRPAFTDALQCCSTIVLSEGRSVGDPYQCPLHGSTTIAAVGVRTVRSAADQATEALAKALAASTMTSDEAREAMVRLSAAVGQKAPPPPVEPVIPDRKRDPNITGLGPAAYSPSAIYRARKFRIPWWLRLMPAKRREIVEALARSAQLMDPEELATMEAECGIGQEKPAATYHADLARSMAPRPPRPDRGERSWV
jgi:hypothetical protein